MEPAGELPRRGSRNLVVFDGMIVKTGVDGKAHARPVFSHQIVLKIYLYDEKPRRNPAWLLCVRYTTNCDFQGSLADFAPRLVCCPNRGKLLGQQSFGATCDHIRELAQIDPSYCRLFTVPLPSAASNRSKTISDFVPTRIGIPHVPTPLLVNTCNGPSRFGP